MVWTKEINVYAKGLKDTMERKETWRINKDGKTDMLLRYYSDLTKEINYSIKK